MATPIAKNYGIPTSPKVQRGTKSDQSFIWVYLEDLEDGQTGHFFPEYSAGNRFHLWDGGGGIGYEHMEEEALAHLRGYVHEKLENKIAMLKAQLAVCERSKTVLEFTGLGDFEVPAEWNPARANGRMSY
jgi:hypothetical protein